jgi:hypothetical protein
MALAGKDSEYLVVSAPYTSLPGVYSDVGEVVVPPVVKSYVYLVRKKERLYKENIDAYSPLSIFFYFDVRV